MNKISSLNRKAFFKLNYLSIINNSKRDTNSASSTSTTSHRHLATDISKLKSKYDVIIIGAGHNGLVAANYLAKYSKRKKLNICVLERRHVVGGAAVTEELISGFKFSRASYLLSLFRPIILKELDLMRHGNLKFYIRNPSSYTPLLETDPQYSQTSKSLTLSSDTHFNREQISKFSRKDAENYEKYETWLNNICGALEPFLDRPPPSLHKLKQKRSLIERLNYLRTIMPDMKSAKFFANNFEDIYRLFTEPAASLLDEWFESDVLKGTLATDSVIGALLSPYSAGSGYVLLHHVIGGIDGRKGVWAYVEGGMGAISNCLAINAKSFPDQQIDIFLNQQVKSIVLDETKTKANGVLLDNDRFIQSDYVLSNCTPHVTFKTLLDKYNLEKHENESISSFFKRVEKINYESGTMKINLAVDRLPNFSADLNKSLNTTQMPHHQCTIHLNSENMKLIDDAYRDTKYLNVPSKRPMIEMVIPSSLDPTLAPKGSHVILLFCQYFPMNRSFDSSQFREDYAKLVLDSIEDYAPGFKNSIIGKDILTPVDLENVFGLTGGNIFHGSMSLNQLYLNRPVAEYSNYKTPIKNLYLAGSGAHPGGGVMGSAGRLAALECLSQIKNS